MYYSAVASMLLGTILATQIMDKKPRTLFLIGASVFVFIANYLESVLSYFVLNTEQFIENFISVTAIEDIGIVQICEIMYKNYPDRTIVSFFSHDSLLQCCVVFLFSFVISVIKWEKYVLNPHQMSKKIIKIMKKGDIEVVEMLAGDMDFWGQVNFGKTVCKYKIVTNINSKYIKKNQNGQYEFYREIEDMDNNNEYLQLKNLCNNANVKLKILCRYNLKQSFSEKGFDDLFDNNFQQILRIAKIKNECPEVEFKFYNEYGEDFGTRARFISYSANTPMKAITYVRTGSDIGLCCNNIKNKKEKRHLNKITIFFGILSSKINKNQVVYKYFSPKWKYSESGKNDIVKPLYNDYFSSKWDKIDAEDSKLIVEKCEIIYSKVQQLVQDSNKNEFYIKTRNKFVLVYLSSYEVAHFKEYRKEFPPFGVMYLAAIIRQSGWDVEIKSINEMEYKLDLRDADVVGLSMVSSYGHNIFKQFVKESIFSKTCYKVAGGYHAEKFYKEVISDLGINLVFVGESENTINEFLNKYRNDMDFPDYIDGTYMSYYPNKYDKILQFAYKQRKDNVNLNTIPFPARYLLPESEIVMTGRLRNDNNARIVHVLFSRGCTKMCLYCGATKDGTNIPVRYRSAENIIEELIYLKKQYRIDGFAIIDDCFLTDKTVAIAICKAIENSVLNLKWSIAARVDQIDLEILGVLKDAGCVEIKFGVESGSDRILNYMNKGCSSKMAEDAINLAHEQGFYVKCFIVSGFPGETAVTTKETLLFLRKLHRKIDSVSLLRFTPLPGSPIFSNPEKYGIDKEKLVLENFDNLHLYHGNYNWWKDEMQFKNRNAYYKVLEQYIERIWKNDKVIY